MEPTAMEIVKIGNAKSNLRSKLKFKKNQEDKDSYMMINVLVSLNCFSYGFLLTIESLKKLSTAFNSSSFF